MLCLYAGFPFENFLPSLKMQTNFTTMIKNLPFHCLLGSLHITTVNIMLILPDPRSALLRAKFRLDNIQQDSVRSRNCLAGPF